MPPVRLEFASIPGADEPQFARMANENILGSLLDPKAIVGMLAVAQYVGRYEICKIG